VKHTLRQSSEQVDRAPQNFFTLAGSAIAGLVIGEVLYVAVTGRIPMPMPMPWWFSASLAYAAAVWAFRETSRWLQAALVLFVAVQVLPYTHLSTAPIVRWGLTAAAQLGMGLLMNVAFWHATRRRVKLVALALVLAAAPIRYWTVYNWHSILDRHPPPGAVNLAEPSNTPLLPTSGT
jgi:hypothetical protein